MRVGPNKSWIPLSNMTSEFAQKLMKDIFEKYVQPEVDSRQRDGIPVDGEVWAAQVIFEPNETGPRIRLNREVRLVAQSVGSTEVKDYVQLYDSGCRAFASVNLAADELNMRHMTLYQIGLTSHWKIMFSLRNLAPPSEPAEGQLAFDAGYQEPTQTEWEALYAEHDRVAQLVLAINSPTPEAPIEAVMAVALQRSRHLVQAYVQLLQAKNLIAASALIRMQVDSVMRVNACFLVSDPLKVWAALKSGEPWKRVKSKSGRSLTDAYLHEQLSTKFDWATDVYREMSEYVHLSRPHLRSTVEGEEFVGMVIHQGPASARVTDHDLAENAQMFIRVTRALLSLCKE